MAKQKASEIRKDIALPEGVTAAVSGKKIDLKGPKGELSREFRFKGVEFSQEGDTVTVSTKDPSKREKRLVGTAAAHLKNMVKGVTDGHQYKLKICAGHFPMNVATSGNELSVKNFFGEKVPRVLKIREGATVTVEGDTITVESASKELAGLVSAEIEQLTKRGNFDGRIFQDGIYITNKDGKELA